MTRNFYAGMALLSLISLSGCSHSSTGPTEEPTAEATGAEHRGGGDRLERMTRELNLTPAQATQMKAIFASMPRRHRRHRDSDESATPDPSAAESRRANREAVEAKIKAVLTPEQWTKYEAMRSHRRHHARPRESE